MGWFHGKRTTSRHTNDSLSNGGYNKRDRRNGYSADIAYDDGKNKEYKRRAEDVTVNKYIKKQLDKRD